MKAAVADLLTAISLTEASRQPHAPFVTLSFPATGAPVIYALMHKGQVVYIGQATNLMLRVGSHAADGKQFDQVIYAPVPAAAVNVLERDLIRCLKPSLNIVHTGRMGARVRRLDGSRPKKRQRREPKTFMNAERVWLLRNGSYWRLAWRAANGKRQTQGLGCIDKVSREQAEQKAREIVLRIQKRSKMGRLEGVSDAK
jgi:hypothetical protein